ncbi:hypothetical protein [Microbacterium lacus]|uniref:hypothetical protein n=1 Tax=Microbacterium lacus TaxID=415217 RepID=UPI000C2B9CFC|nr:hypothetical protein [Microbacterium lacus]
MAKVKGINQITKATERRLREQKKREHATELGFIDMEHYDMWIALEKMRSKNLELRAAQKRPTGPSTGTLPTLYGTAGHQHARRVFLGADIYA